MNTLLINRLLIDNVDAYSTYGIYVAENGYNDLITYPPMKDVVHNDWHEYDGIEIDASSMVLDAYEAQVKFCYNGSFDMETFKTAIGGTVTHVWNFASIGRTYRLRTLSMSQLNMHGDIGFMTIKFAVVELTNGTDTSTASPITTLADNPDYKFDNVMLSKYDIRVLKGSLAEVVKLPDVKPVMTRKVSVVEGAIADNTAPVKYQSKAVRLNLLMTADSLANLWNNYDLFLSVLAGQSAHTLFCNATETKYECYYSKSKVSRFIPTGKPWLEFSLTLVFTGKNEGENTNITNN